MCWSIPAKIVGIKEKIATVEMSGLRKEVGLDLIDKPEVGEYVLVHAGYAIEKVDQDKANFTIDFFNGKFNNA